MLGGIIIAKILVVSHAGPMGIPDDSLDSVRKGVELEADVVELDIRFAGQLPILSHDPVKANQKYETVYDALAILDEAKGVRINADMKEKESLEGLMALKTIFEQFNVKDRLYFSGINRCKAELLQSVFPGYEFFTDWNMNILKRNNETYLLSLVNTAKEKGFSGFNLYYRYVTEKMVKFFQSHGMKVYTWTVEKESDMERLAKWGVDSITTRNPPLLKSVINRITS